MQDLGVVDDDDELRVAMIRKQDDENNNNNIDIIENDNLDKLSWLRGSGVWTVDIEHHSIRLSDGPHGVRKPLSDLTLQKAYPATCFPAGCALACSWNVDLLARVGQALAKECEYYDVQVLLGPAMNIKRHPACGRNMEYFSEDPLLSGLLAAAYVRGVQDSGKVAACLKHFAVNNQESHRMVVDAVVDERTLREIYLRNFEIAIQHSKPQMIMGAYNKLNGVYCCENRWLLESVLREEWQWGTWKDDPSKVGICVSDWGATNSRSAGVAAGMDLEMPGSSSAFGGVCDTDIRNAILEHGQLDVRRGLALCTGRTKHFVQQLDPNDIETGNSTDTTTTYVDANVLFDSNHRVAHEAALECAVLVQNHNNFLPLDASNQTTTKFAVIGAFCKDPRYQGMGSSHVTPTRVENAFDALGELLDKESISYAPGYDPDPQSDKDEDIDQILIQEAAHVAKDANVVLLFLGIPEILESEGFDREHLRLPKQHVELLRAIWQQRGKIDMDKIVVILSNGGAIELPDMMIQHCAAILEVYLGGQAGAGALVDLMFGKANPCGKLPETYPLRQEDIPSNACFPGTRHVVEYREGLNVGYRYFDSTKQVRFPFGHGLSYTSFMYENLKVSVVEDEPRTKRVLVQCDIVNSGTRHAGKEVVQCYVAPRLEHGSRLFRPEHQLQAFAKVHLLQPGERTTIEFDLDHRAFAVWDIAREAWTVETGDYEIQIGASSQDVRLRTTIAFKKGEAVSPLAIESYPAIAAGISEDVAAADEDTFVKRFGQHGPKTQRVLRAYRDEPSLEISNIHLNSMLKEVATISLLGRWLMTLTISVGCKEIPRKSKSYRREVRMVRANVENLPLRSLVLFSKGGLSFEFLDALICFMNGQYLGAILAFLWMIRCSVLDKLQWILGSR